MVKSSFRTKLSQLWVPKPFRLQQPEFSAEQVDLLEELIQLITPTISMAQSTVRDDRVHLAQFLVDLGTGIWRIKRKIENLGRMPKEIREALYSLESTWMSMSEGGVEIVDHIGTIPSKEEAKIIEVRTIPNIAREQVIDAVKPTILLKGEVIQMGEVIMGRPSRANIARPEGVADALPIHEPEKTQKTPEQTAAEEAASFWAPQPVAQTSVHQVATVSVEAPTEMAEGSLLTSALPDEPDEPDEIEALERAEIFGEELPAAEGEVDEEAQRMADEEIAMQEELEAEAVAEAKVEPEQEAELGAEAVVEEGPEAEAEVVEEVEPEPEAEAEEEPEAEAEAEQEPEAEAESAAEPEPEPEAQAEEAGFVQETSSLDALQLEEEPAEPDEADEGFIREAPIEEAVVEGAPKKRRRASKAASDDAVDEILGEPKPKRKRARTKKQASEE